MGYELKLYIGQEWSFDTTIGGKFNHSIHHLAQVDLSNPGYDSRIYKLVQEAQNAEKKRLAGMSKAKRERIRSAIESDVFDARSNNYRRITEDKYGMPLVSIPLVDVHAALEADWEDSKKDYSGWDKGYRRFYIALAVIRPIIETFEKEFAFVQDDAELMAINPLAGQLVVWPYGH